MAVKKILHLSQSTGGVKTYVAHVLNYADPALFDFAVVAPANEGFEEFCKQKSIPYFRVNLERSMNPLKVFKALFQIVRIISKTNPDLIHAHSALGGFLGRVAAKIKGKPIIFTPHAFSYKPFKGLKRSIFYLIECSVRRWTTFVLAISFTEAASAVNELGYDKKKVGVVMNSIPCDEVFKKDCSASVINIRMIGRLTHQKNPILFLHIAERLIKEFPYLRFTILGAGIHDHMIDEIQDFINEKHLEQSVSVLSWGGPDLIENFLKDADIYVSTSIFEGLPFSLLEAMLLGLPCVVSNVEGNLDVINNAENGFSCLNIDSFLEKIRKLILDDSERIRLGEAAYNYVREHHDIKTSIGLLQNIYLDYA